MDTLIFTRSDVAARLGMRECIDAVERAFLLLGRGDVGPPATLAIHADGGAFHIKAGILPHGDRQYFVAKTNGNFPGNPQHGLPTIQGVVLLCDARNGRVLALMDSGELTALRTAAATAVAAKHLARRDARTAGIVGCGLQSRAQLRALREVRPIESVTVYDVDAEAASRFASEMSALLNVPIHTADSVADALSDANVCVTCTTSREFIVHRGMLQPGMFVAGVGVDNEHKRELAPDVLASAKVVTDLREQCARIGDLHHAIEAGVVTRDNEIVELAEVVAGMQPGRENDDEIIVFDSTGIALQDVAAAVAVYESAVGGAASDAVRSVRFSD
jgi:alanine dehydrogenase